MLREEGFVNQEILNVLVQGLVEGKRNEFLLVGIPSSSLEIVENGTNYVSTEGTFILLGQPLSNTCLVEVAVKTRIENGFVAFG